MLGQQGCARLSPARPTFLLFLLLLLLLLDAGVMVQDICSSPGHGDLPAPVFHMIPTAAEEGKQVILQCQISWKSPVTRIIFCKDGVEQYSLKAHQGQENYYTSFPMTMGCAGTFTCGYQHKDNSNQVRNSALSAPQNLGVIVSRGTGEHTGNTPRPPKTPGSSSSSQAETFSNGSAIPLWIWILRYVLTLLLLSYVPIITLMLERWSRQTTGAAQPGDIPIPSAL